MVCVVLYSTVLYLVIVETRHPEIKKIVYCFWSKSSHYPRMAPATTVVSWQ